MAIGIWSAVASSTKTTVFPTLLNNLAAKVQPLVIATGPHVRFVIMGELPIFLVPSPTPASDADAALRGIPIDDDSDVVLALAAGTYYMYSPYENTTVISCEGTLT